MQEVIISKTCKIIDLGFINYQTAYQLQQQMVNEVIEGGGNKLLICEHPPVFTLGRLANEENLLLPKQKIEQQNIRIIRVNRGGEVTFHGPGQIVVYPIFQLKYFGRDLKQYMRKLEQVAIDLLQSFGIVADRMPGQRGVWANQGKIASIGIGVRRWVSFHGMAININTDLNYFSMIKPCGLDVQMVSMRFVKNEEMDISKVKERLIGCFCENFDIDLI